MRILHTSDWHLGQELYGYDRGHEHDVFLQWLLGKLATEHIDVLLVTGDLYDVVNPPVESQQRFYRFLNRALAASPTLQVVAIGGNHDSASRVELPRELLDPDRVRLIGCLARSNGAIDQKGVVVELKDATGTTKAVCAAVPYLRAGDLPSKQNGADPVAQVYERVIQEARTHGAGLPLVVTGHLHIAGGAISELSERRIFLGGEEAVSSDIFPADVAYVALGHLHKPQMIPAAIPIRYAGSPFPLSSTERDYEHSVAVIDLSSQPPEISLIRTPRPTPFMRTPETGAVPISEIESLLGALAVECSDERFRPYLEINVLMDGPVPDLRNRIDTLLADKPVRLTRIVRERTASPLSNIHLTASQDLSELDPMQMFIRRYTNEYGAGPPESLQQRFLQLVEAAHCGMATTESGAA